MFKDARTIYEEGKEEMSGETEFEEMSGFHVLESLWKIEYKAVSMEPIITQAATEETQELVDSIIGKKIPKDMPDAVPLIIGGKAVITGNAVKGVFRHLISSQLTKAGLRVCCQKVKGRSGIPEGRVSECDPENPCFVCTWFGTPSRQGALYFSLLRSVKGIEEVLADEPIPMIALREDYRAVDPKARAFMLLAPIRENVEFRGWIKGENLSKEIIGAIKEIQDMSERGFVQFGGYKTRGFGALKIEILKIEKYGTTPFKLEKLYEGEELRKFLEDCQRRYHSLMDRGKRS